MLKFISGCIANIEYVAAALALGLVLGFGGGWKVHSWKVGAEQTTQAKATLKADAHAVNTATEEGKANEAKKDAIGNDVSHARKELASTPVLHKPAPKVVTRIVYVKEKAPATPNPQPKTETSNDKDCPPTLDVLSVYGVGVLNHALNPTAPDPAKWDPATKQTPSDTGLREVSDLAARIGEQYRKLGADYDAVMQRIEEYNKQIEQSR